MQIRKLVFSFVLSMFSLLMFSKAFSVTIEEKGHEISIDLEGKKLSFEQAEERLKALCTIKKGDNLIKFKNVTDKHLDKINKLADAIVQGYRDNPHKNTNFDIEIEKYKGKAVEIESRLVAIANANEERQMNLAYYEAYNETRKRNAYDRMVEQRGSGADYMLDRDNDYLGDYLSDD